MRTANLSILFYFIFFPICSARISEIKIKHDRKTNRRTCWMLNISFNFYVCKCETKPDCAIVVAAVADSISLLWVVKFPPKLFSYFCRIFVFIFKFTIQYKMLFVLYYGIEGHRLNTYIFHSHLVCSTINKYNDE